MNRELTVLGIDPGLDGAFALVHPAGVNVWDVPTITLPKASKSSRSIDAYAVAHLFETFKALGVDHVCVEMVANRPGLASPAVLKTGESFGVIEGLLIGLKLPWSTVAAQVWTKALRVGADKQVHRLTAQRLYPEHAQLFGRVKDDGRADAALIARWWIEHRIKELAA